MPHSRVERSPIEYRFHTKPLLAFHFSGLRDASRLFFKKAKDGCIPPAIA
jgi:hypothetical protein